MKKFVIASHGKMAKGIKSTLELFVGTEIDVTYMSAYMEDEPAIEEQISEFFSGLESVDQAVIFTDLFGGSVNQKLTLAAADRKNVFLIAGFNLPLIIEIIFGAEVYTKENLEGFITGARQAMQLVENLSTVDQEEGNQLATEDREAQAANGESIKNSSGMKAVQTENVPTLSHTELAPLETTLRVDERLIHGQIAMVWSRALNLHGIIVANDEVAADQTQQMALKMAVPSGVKVLIRSVDNVAEILQDPRIHQTRVLVLVKTVTDALRLAEKVPNLKYLNIGNVGKLVTEEKQTLTQFVMLSAKEMASLKKLAILYPEAALQNLPSDKKVLATEFL